MSARARHCATLGLPANASEAEITKRYRRLSMKNHPDKGGDVEVQKALNVAYEALTKLPLPHSFDEDELQELRKVLHELRGELDAVKRRIEKSQEAGQELQKELLAATVDLDPQVWRADLQKRLQEERKAREREEEVEAAVAAFIDALHPTKAAATTTIIEGEEAAIGGTGCCGGSWGCWGFFKILRNPFGCCCPTAAR
ncbi:unnamed protein product [Vitrella brassicaformis CCMP3155]|uniref:J domain-containing protein n=1 Tax=Vitrella brassicaformis (strain CCMP3155) TaxID=1169540 RepID=A0A0G4FJC7_VITBC|nr:unnamed protein product [Vitrella brassicaformis CCMP3155]|eukprot:CEM13192.1 unnamed protein product [Vitrella brassicaformis CCMP3155]